MSTPEPGSDGADHRGSAEGSPGGGRTEPPRRLRSKRRRKALRSSQRPRPTPPGQTGQRAAEGSTSAQVGGESTRPLQRPPVPEDFPASPAEEAPHAGVLGSAAVRRPADAVAAPLSPPVTPPTREAAREAAAAAPETVSSRRAGRPARRRVVVRRVDPWAIFRVSLVFYFCLLLVVMLGLAIFWVLVTQIGAVATLVDFLADLQLTITVNGGMIARAIFLVGLLNVLLWSGINLFLAFLYNLIADLVGGLRMTLEEEA